MNAIATTAPPLAYGDLERLAESIAKSGLFGIKTKDQAIALMMIAHAEGRHPALAARDYDIIQGRPAKKAEAMMRDFLEAGGKVEWHSVTDTLADATFSHPQTGSVRIDWDMKRAKTAFGERDMYTKFPRQMLRSRVVSEGVRTLWPLATSGMYIPEEVADMKPEHNGPTIEAEPPPSRRDQMNAEIPLRAAAAPTPRGATVRGPVEPPATNGNRPKPVAKDHWLFPLEAEHSGQWFKNLDVLLSNAQSQAEVVEIAGHSSVGIAIAAAPPAIRARIDAMLATAFGRFAEPEPEPTLDEVEIEGADKMGAG